jgi:hypothetical protein
MTERSLPGIDAISEPIAECVIPPCPELFLIVAYHHNGYWTVPAERPGPYTCLSDAENAADELATCWTAYRIVRIPGTAT